MKFKSTAALFLLFVILGGYVYFTEVRGKEERQKQEEYLRAHPPPPQPPSITFQFIGYMGPPEERIGVFATPSLLLARKGDTILSKFKVVSIGYESAEIGFAGFTQTQRIPLSAGGK